MAVPRVIAIDGPAGSGKSTLAGRLAAAVGLPYVNTGLMYRALTLRALEAGIDLDDGPALATRARRMRFELSSRLVPNVLLIEGEPASDALSSADVERAVSKVASHPEVREVLRTIQRRLGEGGAVMEGRDIGSVVFPDAPLKIFLVAEPQVRAARRVKEREQVSPVRGVAEALAHRNARDALVNPFVPAADAIAIETTGKDAATVFEEALALAAQRLGRWSR
jgi:cytidylate kinase